MANNSSWLPNPASQPSLSIVIAAYTMKRWVYLQELVASLQRQTHRPTEIVIVVDHCPELLARARTDLSGVRVIPNVFSRGASGARNSGVECSNGEIVAFLDDDVIASSTWASQILCHFRRPEVIGIGGQLTPLWSTSRPSWFPAEFYWTIGVSYRGMPEATEPVRNVWSSNMAIRRVTFDAIGGFRDDFGKVGSRSRPEDTDLCIRALAVENGKTWIYEPAAVVSHHVPAERGTFKYFLIRCFDEGWGKACLVFLDGMSEGTSVERRYTREVLPAGVVSGLREAITGDIGGILRAFAITAGFSVTAVAFIAGRAGLTLRSAVGGRRVKHSGRSLPDVNVP